MSSLFADTNRGQYQVDKVSVNIYTGILPKGSFAKFDFNKKGVFKTDILNHKIVIKRLENACILTCKKHFNGIRESAKVLKQNFNINSNRSIWKHDTNVLTSCARMDMNRQNIKIYSVRRPGLETILASIEEIKDDIICYLNNLGIEIDKNYISTSVSWLEVAYDIVTKAHVDFAKLDSIKEALNRAADKVQSGIFNGEEGQTKLVSSGLNSIGENYEGHSYQLNGYFKDGSVVKFYKKEQSKYHAINRAENKLSGNLIRGVAGTNAFKDYSSLKKILDCLAERFFDFLKNSIDVPAETATQSEESVKAARNYINTIFGKYGYFAEQHLLEAPFVISASSKFSLKHSGMRRYIRDAKSAGFLKTVQGKRFIYEIDWDFVNSIFPDETSLEQNK